jgi:hypothetical protein
MTTGQDDDDACKAAIKEWEAQENPTPLGWEETIGFHRGWGAALRYERNRLARELTARIDRP